MSKASMFRYAELVKQNHRVLAGMSRADRAAQLSYSSIDEDFVPVLDALAQVRMSLGRQPDNQYAVRYENGNPPPAPTGFVVAPREGAMLCGWDGTFFAGAARPSDLARVDIHASEAGPDFTPTGATVVGYLLGEAATLIPIDHVTHYVKIVAVSLSDVASVPSDTFAVLPEPIGVIAAGAIGANELAATIILTTDLYVGDPNASHLFLSEGEGMIGYSNTLQKLLHFDVSTGSFSATGEISSTSATSGKRIVLNPIDSGSSLPEIRFYPANTSNFSFINAPAVGDDNVAGIGLNTGTVNDTQYTVWIGQGFGFIAQTSTGGLKDGPFVNVNSSGVQIGYDLRSESVQRGAIRLDDLGEVSFDGFVQKAGGYYAPYPAMIFDFIDWDGGSVTFGFDRTIPGSFQSVAGNFLVWNVNYNANVSHQFYNPHNTGVSAGTGVANVNGRYSLIVYRTRA